MTTVTISQVTDASGVDVVASVSIILVDATGTHRIGWQVSTGGPISEYVNLRLYRTALSLSLVPTSDIAIDADASPTWYKITISTGNRDEPYLVQVPDSLTAVDLIDLVGADPEDPAAFMDQRLVPTGGMSGQFIVADANGDPQWATKFTGFNSIAAVDALPVPEVAGVLYLVKS